MEAPKVTLRDIAREARVSVMAVSMALRHHPRISPETRKKIQAIARRLNYRRDPMLSALSAYRRGRKRISSHLAFVTTGATPTDWQMEFELLMFKGAQQEAQKLGFELVHYWLDPAISGARHSRALEARGFAGLIIATLATYREIDLDCERFCAVELGGRLQALPLHFASPNHFGGLLLVCTELQKLGYRRIGLSVPGIWDEGVDHRWSAALRHFQAQVPPTQRVKPLWDDVWTRATFLGWVDKEKPDVVLTYGDAHYWWLEESGRRVPRDIGVALLDNEAHLREIRAFSGLNQNFTQVGAAAVGLLHSQCISGHLGMPPVRMAVVVDGTWEPGDTTRRQSAAPPLKS